MMQYANMWDLLENEMIILLLKLFVEKNVFICYDEARNKEFNYI